MDVAKLLSSFDTMTIAQYCIVLAIMKHMIIYVYKISKYNYDLSLIRCKVCYGMSDPYCIHTGFCSDKCNEPICSDCLDEIIMKAGNPGDVFRACEYACPFCRNPYEEAPYSANVQTYIDEKFNINDVGRFCIACGQLEIMDMPTCGVTLDTLNLTCNECTDYGIKLCPNKRCKAKIMRADGCDYVKCTQCRADFCWGCSNILPSSQIGDIEPVFWRCLKPCTTTKIRSHFGKRRLMPW
jgi:hypothetical protein